MRDISPVKAFSLHDVSLLPNHFFGRYDLDLQTKDRGFASMLEPDIINRSQSVPRTENDVDIHTPGLNFRQPMSKRVVSCVTSFSPHRQCRLDVIWAKEKVKVFRVPINAGVFSERISTSNQKFNFVIVKELHDASANLAPALRLHSIKCALQSQSASM